MAYTIQGGKDEDVEIGDGDLGALSSKERPSSVQEVAIPKAEAAEERAPATEKKDDDWAGPEASRESAVLRKESCDEAKRHHVDDDQPTGPRFNTESTKPSMNRQALNGSRPMAGR